MIETISPSRICWYGTIPSWVETVYDRDYIIKIPKRFENVKRNIGNTMSQLELF